MFFVGGLYINMFRLFEIQSVFLQNVFSDKTLLFKYVWTSTFMGLYGIWVEEENVGSFVFGPWGKTCLKRPNSKVGNFDNYVLNGENGTHTLILFFILPLKNYGGTWTFQIAIFTWNWRCI